MIIMIQPWSRYVIRLGVVHKAVRQERNRLEARL
jgi:hypothetical protein